MTNKEAIKVLENIDSVSVLYGDGALAIAHAIQILQAVEELSRIWRYSESRFNPAAQERK